MYITAAAEEQVVKQLASRATRLDTQAVLKILDGKRIFLAGGALMPGAPNDYDLYPGDGQPFNHVGIRHVISNNPKARIVCETGNALTVRIDDQTVQFCSFMKTSLQDLCDSFDFAHCQAGVTFEAFRDEDDGTSCYRITDVYASENWVQAKLQESTFYTGSEYPLGALLRVLKYEKRGLFIGKSWMDSVFHVLRDLMNRGFRDRDDFRRQLESIDLGITDGGNMDWLYEVFDLNGLVKSSPTDERQPSDCVENPDAPF